MYQISGIVLKIKIKIKKTSKLIWVEYVPDMYKICEKNNMLSENIWREIILLTNPEGHVQSK